MTGAETWTEMFTARFPEQSRVRVALRQRVMRRLAAARSRHMRRRALHPTEGDHIGLYPVECCADRQNHRISPGSAPTRAPSGAAIFTTASTSNRDGEPAPVAAMASSGIVEDGPLLGSVIVAYPTSDAPFTYFVEVYKRTSDSEYSRALRYRGHTGYGDGNPLAVIDSEMPETLRQLGLWKTGDALPVPPRMPAGCTRLVMRKGVERCEP